MLAVWVESRSSSLFVLEYFSCLICQSCEVVVVVGFLSLSLLHSHAPYSYQHIVMHTGTFLLLTLFISDYLSRKELQRCHGDLKRTRADLDKQKSELDRKNEALETLKKASAEKEAELQSEMGRLKEQFQKEKAELEKALEKAKEVI